MTPRPEIRMRIPVSGLPAAPQRPDAAQAGERASLCDLLDGLLDTGVVVSGELTVTVAGIELLYVALELVACSWETAADLSPGAGRR